MAKPKQDLEWALRRVESAVNNVAYLLWLEFKKRGFEAHKSRYYNGKRPPTKWFHYNQKSASYAIASLDHAIEDIHEKREVVMVFSGDMFDIKMTLGRHKHSTITHRVPRMPVSKLNEIGEIFDLLASFLQADTDHVNHPANRAYTLEIKQEIIRLVTDSGYEFPKSEKV